MNIGHADIERIVKAVVQSMDRAGVVTPLPLTTTAVSYTHLDVYKRQGTPTSVRYFYLSYPV